MSQTALEQDAPPPMPSDPSDVDPPSIEVDGRENNGVADGGEENDERSIEAFLAHAAENNQTDNTGLYGGDDEEDEVIEAPGEDEEEERQRRRLLIRIGREVSASLLRRQALMRMDHLIGRRLAIPESDTYFGNPGDYVDAAGYEALLQDFAESDSGERRGAPPAAKAAVEGLQSVVIGKEEDKNLCAICRDMINVGEVAKNLPCGHGYHGECIVPWLGKRNSCPFCRFELPTDDPEYENQRKKRKVVEGSSMVASSSSSSSSDADQVFILS